MQVLSPDEIDPASRGLTGDIRLTDTEDGDVAEVTVTGALLKRYRKRLDTYCGTLREFCTRVGMMHVMIDSSVDMQVLLVEYLRKRGMLK